MRFLIVLLSLISFNANADFISQNVTSGTIYYVAASGNDTTGNGTASKPWATLPKACTTVTAPNSTIYVRGVGVNVATTCALNIGVSIKCEKPTTYLKSTTALAPMISAYSATQGVIGNHSIDGCVLDGNARTGSAAFETKGRSYVKIINSTVKDWDDHGVDFTGTSTSAEDNVLTGQVATKLATNNEFKSNTCTDSTKFSGYGRGCLQIGSQDGFIASDNTFSENTRAGVGGSNGWNIKFLRGGGLKDLKLLRNTFAREAKDGDTFNFNVELTGLTGRSEIAYNTFTSALDINGTFPSTEGSSLDYHDNVAGRSTFNTVACTTGGCKDIGVILEYNTSNVYIRNNRFKNLQTVLDLQFHNDTGTIYMDNIRYENNLAYNVCTGLSTSGTSPTVLARLSNLYIQHTTTYGAGNTICGGVGAGFYVNNGIDVFNVVVRNNIVQNFNLAPIMFYGSTTKIFDSVNIDSNLFFGNGNSNNAWQNGVVISNYSETNTIKSDPLFKNGSTLLNTELDFKLSGSSPAKYTGLDIVMPMDTFNTPRQSKSSMGAIEYRTGD
jgi:hypothetical protein